MRQGRFNKNKMSQWCSTKTERRQWCSTKTKLRQRAQSSNVPGVLSDVSTRSVDRFNELEQEFRSEPELMASRRGGLTVHCADELGLVSIVCKDEGLSASRVWVDGCAGWTE